MKKVGIITLNYNGAEDVIECLESLDGLLLKDIELRVYIIDNHSHVQNVNQIEHFLQKKSLRHYTAELLKNTTNVGFSQGNNIGIKKALADICEYIILLNNDTLVDQHLVEELVKAADASKKTSIIVPKIYFSPGYEFHKTRYTKDEVGKVIWYAGGNMDWNNVIGVHRGVDQVDRNQFDLKCSTELATGCCMLLTPKIIQMVGSLDPAYFMYYEDADYSIRAKKESVAILYYPEAKLWHKNAGSAGGPGSTLQDYFISRNRMLFGMKYAPLRTKFALFRESVKVLITGRYWQRRGVIDYYLHRFGKGSYGISS